MEALCVDLDRALKRQGEILKEMLAAVRAHNQALRRNDVVALREITGREEEVAARLKEEDRRREEAHTALAGKLGVPVSAPLSELLPRLPEAQKDILSRLANELKNTAGEIAGLLELNSVLTRRALHFGEVLLKLINPEQNSVYHPDGKAAPPAGRPPLINKTV